MARDDSIPMAIMAQRLGRRFELSPAATDALIALPHSVRDFAPGQYLVREGTPARQSSFLISGFVFRQKIVADGGRQIVAIHMTGDFIDLQHIMLDQADHNIQALTSATLAQFPSEELLDLAFRFPEIGRALWLESLIEAATFREWVVNVGRRDAQARTAHLLCELATRREAAGLGPRFSYELPMSQEQLGDALALTSAHINRTLKRLEAAGLIERRQRSVTVADWAGLRRTGNFDPAYLHLEDLPD
ncbi:Crp/Fnr family transcriptional regulator [Sphingomonas sp. 28-63-12]|uniref:Crp/Fnr family transcriptional regulator n=1 Tax=Sphingomonas sp. 28-63-12 TaxID=1970434 RepID=UPI0035A97727